jgi:hypothetical protein
VFKARTIKYGYTAIFTTDDTRYLLANLRAHLIELQIGRFGNSMESDTEDWINIEGIDNTGTEDNGFLHLRIIGSKLGRKEKPQYVVSKAEVNIKENT